jgi:predicted ribosome quality control (RQC) complex YloA/Tae2 family protein
MEKRQRERVRRQKQLDKERRRAQRAAERQERQLKGSKDADLEGTTPGPETVQIVELP